LPLVCFVAFQLGGTNRRFSSCPPPWHLHMQSQLHLGAHFLYALGDAVAARRPMTQQEAMGLVFTPASCSAWSFLPWEWHTYTQSADPTVNQFFDESLLFPGLLCWSSSRSRSIVL